MFEMFKNMGQMAGLLGKMGKIQEEMAKLKGRLDEISAEGDAGAGMVKAKVNGKGDLVGLKISDEVMKLNDREMLEDLVRSAVNQAITKARELAAEETGKVASGLGLPPGMGLPG